MKLLTEQTTDIECLIESAGGGKKNYYVEGVFMQANITNRNRRIYPKSIMEKEVDRYNKENILPRRAYGELNHPASPAIDMTKISHIFESLRMEGDNVIGKAKVIDTPNGNIVKTLIDEKCSLGVSSRGTGSIASNHKGVAVVQEDFRLSTAGDIVANPSAPDAYVNAVMESAEWHMDDTGNWILGSQFDLEEEDGNGYLRAYETFRRFVATL